MTRILVLVLLTASLSTAFGAEIVLVYPRNDNARNGFEYEARLDSTFLLGHVLPSQGELTINGHAVPLTAEGAFLAWLPIAREPDTREWLLRFRNAKGDSTELRFAYSFRQRVVPPDTLETPFSPRVVKITEPNAQIRTEPEGSYFVFPDSGCLLMAVDHRRGFYTVRLGNGQQGAVDERWVTLQQDTQLMPATLGDGYCRPHSDFSECVFALDRTVPWCARLVDDDRALQVTLFDTRASLNRIRYDLSDSLIREITWAQCPEGVVLRFAGKWALTHGYRIAYENDSLRAVLRKLPSAHNGVNGKTIVIDPGHGGDADGAIGPLGTKEKDVVLRLALFLENELTRQGANVMLTRRDDRDLGLYERVNLAREARADLLLSLHANALADGENPQIRHGSATYYYHPHSRPAAEIIHRRLLKTAGLRDDGLWYGSLALARPTECPAVLVEVAYLIYPPEEHLLRSDKFLRKLAQGLARGIGDYFENP
jgi:N-acetylmuramoyl-L-alanine amidase